MARQEVSGPSSLAISSGSSSAQGQYFAAKTPATWSVEATSDGTLAPGDYTATISSTGLLTVTLAPGVVVAAPGTTLKLAVHASSGPGNGNNDTLDVTTAVDSTVVPCFVSGTTIATVSGETPVTELAVGDLVRTATGETTQIRWVGSRSLSKAELDRSPKLRPVRIPKGSLGRGTPDRDLLVSPLHRVRICGWRAQMLIGEREVLVHAAHLAQAEAVDENAYRDGVRYFHILCDRHEVIIANGTPTETLLPGEIARSAFEPAMLSRMTECLSTSSGGLHGWKSALPCLGRKEALMVATKDAVS